MVDEAKFVGRILQQYVANSGEVCSSEKDCGGIALDEGQAKVLSNVLADGVITADERAKLGFLPSAVVSGIAGDQGTKPAEMKIAAIEKQIAALKPEEDIGPIIEQLKTMAPAVRSLVRAVIERALASPQRKAEEESATKKMEAVKKQYAAIETQIRLAEERNEALNAAPYEAIDRLPGPTHQRLARERLQQQESLLHRQAGLRDKQIEPMRNEARRLYDQLVGLQKKIEQRYAQEVKLRNFKDLVILEGAAPTLEELGQIAGDSRTIENREKAYRLAFEQHSSDKRVQEAVKQMLSAKKNSPLGLEERALFEYAVTNDATSSLAEEVVVKMLRGEASRLLLSSTEDVVKRVHFVTLEKHLAEFPNHVLAEIIRTRGNQTVAQKAIQELQTRKSDSAYRDIEYGISWDVATQDMSLETRLGAAKALLHIDRRQAVKDIGTFLRDMNLEPGVRLQVWQGIKADLSAEERDALKKIVQFQYRSEQPSDDPVVAAIAQELEAPVK